MAREKAKIRTKNWQKPSKKGDFSSPSGQLAEFGRISTCPYPAWGRCTGVDIPGKTHRGSINGSNMPSALALVLNVYVEVCGFIYFLNFKL